MGLLVTALIKETYFNIFSSILCFKGCFQYNDAKPTDDTSYKPGQPGAQWSSDEIDIVREKVGKARFFLETNFCKWTSC